jgi:type I restriction enzyme R subunit
VVQADAIYFVTFRQYDSIPKEQMIRWNLELQRWHEQNPPPHTPQQSAAFADLGYRRVERWLDRCSGDGLLKDDTARKLVSDCLKHRDEQDYWLGDYVIMPNHVHVLLQVTPDQELKTIMETWYGVTTHRINKALKRSGTLWQPDPFDHIIRDDEELTRTRAYIRNNGRHLKPGTWAYGSGSLFAGE